MESGDDVEGAVAQLLKSSPELVSSVLSGRGLADLEQLPAVLNEEKERLASETSSLVYENYATFLRLAVNVSKTRRAVNETKVLQGALLEDVKQLETSCLQFGARGAELGERRERAKELMLHFPLMLELLELPQLINACVRSRSYERALELLQISRKTLAQHRSIPLLDDVMRDVKSAADLMREQILLQLSSDCDMETTIRSVDHLRRLDVDGDELDLRVRFLQVREQWMENGKLSLPSSPLGRWLMAYAERLRTDLFYVVTQYNTLFAGECAGGSHLLWAFASRKVKEFVQVLEKNVPFVSDGEEIGAIIEQCMYCGSSLSRVGMDFRLLTHSVFEQSIVSMFQHRLDSALFFFSESLRSHDWKMDAASESEVDEGQSKEGENAAPPMSLLRHAPLAILANELLEALNQLRYCAVVTISDQVSAATSATLKSAQSALEGWSRALVGKQQMLQVCEGMKQQMAELATYIEAKQRIILAAPAETETE